MRYTVVTDHLIQLFT